MELDNAISSVLFYQAEPVSIKRLSALLKRDEADISVALDALRSRLPGVGLCLIENGNEVTLGTSPEASALLEAMTKEELSKDISKAGLETLAIVLYKGPITRSEIDYIRGVNSTFILRNLLIRGLVEKVENPADMRSFLYTPTFQLLEYMGVGNRNELPEYHDTIAELGKFVEGKAAEDTLASTPPTDTDMTEEGAASTDELVDASASDVGEEMEHEQFTDELLADVAEEDMTAPGFDDDALHAHTDDARHKEEQT